MCAYNYFEEIDTPENKAFLKGSRQRLGRITLTSMVSRSVDTPDR